jgi:ubiquinone/menaquinone biosynthesis C-methylase UbiE
MVDRKRALFSTLAANATVVELGPGTGPNFDYYPRTIEWIGVEPNAHLNPALHEASRGFNTRLLTLAAESLPLADASADAVVCTLVLCSAANPAQVLRESLRILKRGGRFYFVEHVGAPKRTALRVGQRMLSPFWRAIADGCHTCRDTACHIQAAGFARVELQSFSLPLGPLAPHIMGVAHKHE